MKKYLAIIAICTLFYNFSDCGRCDSKTNYDSGTISEKSLQFVPYKENDTIRFVHSKGSIISFTVARTHAKHADYDRCATFIIDEDKTILTPNYPIFSPVFTITQLDSLRISYDMYIQQTYFTINPELYIDSISLHTGTYYNVYAIQGYREFPSSKTIKPDSLYYNTTYGILRITMSNGEWYERKN
ncbi:MAG TPA: hypothetical protein P5243_07215 [Bacteroidales bacterium]|jgi:hypothetical protein|nr:hypothetical protein [Bacteroidales bacterium]